MNPFLLVPLLLLTGQAHSNSVNLKPRQTIAYDGLGSRFGGDRSSPDVSDHFKLLAADGESLLVGARNAVYNLSLATLNVNHKIDWKPPAQHIEACIMKGKTKGECQNYVRVLARKLSGQALVCGTHAFSPKCREYTYSGQDNALKNTRQFDGQGISPYDPQDNATALFIPESGEIFSGTVTDFAGNDALIYRKSINELDNFRGNVRTQKDDIRVLNEPNFVSSFLYREHVYFWFSEVASEAVDNNEERVVYARVGRVCRNDKGGARPANERWTSFLKARLNCSLPSSSPFYFNELKAVSEPVAAGSNDHTVYAIFSTPSSSVQMSAVCAFSMKRIRDEFDYGSFKHQRSVQSLWQPYNRNEIPKPRPGACVPDSTKLPEATISFVLRNPLMHKAVESIGPPLLIEGADRPDLTQVAVLSNVEAVNGHKYDVLFIGTSAGRVMKAVEVAGVVTVIQSTSVFHQEAPVVNLLTRRNQMVVVSSDEIVSLDVYYCKHQTTCSGCVKLQDPHCAWDQKTFGCVHRESWTGGDFIQNIVSGKSDQCADWNDHVVNEEVEIQQERIMVSSAGQMNMQGLLLPLLLTAIVCLFVGGLFGYKVSQMRTVDSHRSASSTSGSDYDSFGRARLTRHDSLTTTSKIDHPYMGNPPKASMDAASLILSMNHSVHAPVVPHPMSMSQHTSGVNTPSRDKNAILTSINQSTLPRDYKVKKVYL